jgi:hypothetical protein
MTEPLGSGLKRKEIGRTKSRARDCAAQLHNLHYLPLANESMCAHRASESTTTVFDVDTLQWPFVPSAQSVTAPWPLADG